MLLNIAADVAKLSLYIVCAYVLLGFELPQWAHPEHRSNFHRCSVERGADLAPSRDLGNDACCPVDRFGCSAASRAGCPLAFGCVGGPVHWRFYAAGDQCGL